MEEVRSFQYRKFYENETGVKVSDSNVIHHLDRNRYNNSIENLVSIDRFDHYNCHKALLKAYNPSIEMKWSYVDEDELLYAKDILDRAILERDSLLLQQKEA